MKAPFKDLCLGARFTYKEGQDRIYVKIDHRSVALWDPKEVATCWIGQGIFSFDEHDDVSREVFLVEEPARAVLDKPARVGSAVFRAGIAVETVISAAQRAHEASGSDHLSPEGYQAAFYKIADLLKIPAQPISPKEVWETQMLPQLEAAISTAGATTAAQDISTAPADTDVLVWWPLVKLDDYGDPTDEVVGGRWLISENNGGYWVEPDCMNAVGEHMGDDETYADTPSHWMPLPAKLFSAPAETEPEQPEESSP